MLIAMHYSGHKSQGSSVRLLGQVWASPTLVSSIAYIYGVHCSVCEWLRSACNNGKWQTPNKCERRWPWKMMLMNDSQEGQPGRTARKDSQERQPGRTASTCTSIIQGMAVVLAPTGTWSTTTYCMYVYKGWRLCINRLNTEGGRDSAPWPTSAISLRCLK